MRKYLRNYSIWKLLKLGIFCFITLIVITVAFTLPSTSKVSALQNNDKGITPSANPQQYNLLSTTPQISQESLAKKDEKKQDPKFAEKAKDLISVKNKVSKDKLKVANAKDAEFQFSGKKSHDVKLIDEQGKIYGLSLDDNGQELDYNALVKEDLEAKKVKYGKFEPSFFEKLTKEPDDKPVKAIIALHVPYYDPVSRPWGQLPDNGSNISQEQIDKLNTKEYEDYITHLQPVIGSITEKLKAKGNVIKIESIAGSISIELSPKVLKEIQSWDEIDGISDGNIKLTPALASARSSSGITAINNRTINGVSINGTGVKVAQIEVPGGRVKLDNPYLSTGIIQDNNSAVCTNPDEHATLVAGVLKSINLADTGVSTGATLWASGVCSGIIYDVYNRMLDGVQNQSASVTNFSWGCSSLQGCVTYPDSTIGQYDGMAFYNTHPSFIVAAGNNGVYNNSSGQDGTSNIYSIATAYNLITVGSYDDKNNTVLNDDEISDFTSWKNPTSQHGDREKPDVVAPGSNIRTTGYTPNLIEVSGTSFSAPVVTGGSALLMQRASVLKNEPEALKALILATARNDVAKDGQMPSGDSKDGYGGVDFDWADKLLQGQTGGAVYFGDYRCESTPTPYIISTNISNLQPYRAFFVWRVNWYDPSYSAQPNMDLDITIKDPNGSIVGSSASYDNNIEGVYFYPTVTGNYTMEVNRYRCDSPYTYTRFAAGWSPVPAYLAEYFNNKTLSGTPILRRYEDFINNDWGYGSPGSGVNSDNFSARWTKTDNFNAGTYEFTSTSDDGVRLYIDNTLILDKWIDQGSTTYKVNRDLTAGNHTIKYEYYENIYGALAKLSYEKVTPIVSGGIYRLVNQCSGKVLDVSGGLTGDTVNIQQWGWNGGNNQRWKIESVATVNGTTYYKLTAQHSSKVAEVWGLSQLDGGNVDQYTWNGGNNQQWSISNVGAEYSKLLARHDILPKAMDVNGASIDDGANVQQWGDNGSCAQRWRLDKL